MRHFLKIAAMALLVAGCASTSATITVFHRLPAQGNGETIAIRAPDEALTGTMEFQAYADKLAPYLRAAGYNVVPYQSGNPPRYLAHLTYGVDNGHIVVNEYAEPVYGRGPPSYVTTTATLPNGQTVTQTRLVPGPYGVVGMEVLAESSREYNRVLELSIYETAGLRPGDRESLGTAEVFNAKLTSAGRCGAMAPVIDPLLETLFRNFPGESGKTRTENSTIKVDC